MNCYKCDRTAAFALIAVRCVDAEVLDSIDSCHLHAVELIDSGRQPLNVSMWKLEPLVEDCVAHGGEGSSERLDMCANACGKYADIWLGAGAHDELNDLDRGIDLCGPCVESAERMSEVIRAELRRSLGGGHSEHLV